jgi:hypothetical protein
MLSPMKRVCSGDTGAMLRATSFWGGGRTTAGRISCGHNIKIEMSPTAAERMQRIPEFEDIVSMRG